ncbi:hypothetical protein SEVCU057_0724 [Staphylococcus epidermidis VCU057]|nr:hypothetical protein SEVCU057_0724 [Staphylococcus epidermidis VCU057]
MTRKISNKGSSIMENNKFVLSSLAILSVVLIVIVLIFI